jgi:hypothetical protein
MEEETPPCGLELYWPTPIRMSMERKLNLTERAGNPIMKQPANAKEKIEDVERFSRMMNTSHIDKKKLWQNVEQALKKKTTATLAEIIGVSGVENGIAEVVSYFSFLRENAARVQSMQEITELIPLNKEKTRFIEVPYLLFSR